jgi:PPOX class probable F420-dependent enzyme
VPAEPILTGAERSFLAQARRATLATVGPGGRPRLVPICFVVGEDDRFGAPRLYSPLDEKPKRSENPRDLGRVQDLLVLPEVTLLVDQWSEDWTQLGWLRVYGRGILLEPEPHEVEEHEAAVALLRDKYEQYRSQAIDARPMIRMTLDRAVSWGNLDVEAGPAASGRGRARSRAAAGSASSSSPGGSRRS